MLHPTLFALIALAIASAQAAGAAQTQQASDTSVADTAWVDSPNPVFTPTALLRLNQLWSSRNYRGVCLRGEVRRDEKSGDAVHVTQVFSAAFPNLCSGFKNIGAAAFRYDKDEADSEPQSSCELLRAHPEWAVAAVVTGIETRKLRSPEGQTVVTAAAPVASYCAWLRKGRSEAEVPPKPS